MEGGTTGGCGARRGPVGCLPPDSAAREGACRSRAGGQGPRGGAGPTGGAGHGAWKATGSRQTQPGGTVRSPGTRLDGSLGGGTEASGGAGRAGLPMTSPQRPPSSESRCLRCRRDTGQTHRRSSHMTDRHCSPTPQHRPRLEQRDRTDVWVEQGKGQKEEERGLKKKELGKEKVGEGVERRERRSGEEGAGEGGRGSCGDGRPALQQGRPGPGGPAPPLAPGRAGRWVPGAAPARPGLWCSWRSSKAPTRG